MEGILSYENQTHNDADPLSFATLLAIDLAVDADFISGGFSNNPGDWVCHLTSENIPTL
jgi:hypothetical protein